MRTVRGLVAALLVGLGVVAFAPAPAFACSCATSGTKDFVDHADVVVVGTFTDRDEPAFGHLFGGEDPVTYTVEVDSVHRGNVGRSVEVLTPEYGASCGLEGIEPGKRYVVFATHHTIMAEPTEDLWAFLCGGTAPASGQMVAEVEAILGPGRAPPPPAADNSVPDAGNAVAAPAALAAGGGLAVLTGLLWLRLRRP